MLVFKADPFPRSARDHMLTGGTEAVWSSSIFFSFFFYCAPCIFFLIDRDIDKQTHTQSHNRQGKNPFHSKEKDEQSGQPVYKVCIHHTHSYIQLNTHTNTHHTHTHTHIHT